MGPTGSFKLQVSCMSFPEILITISTIPSMETDLPEPMFKIKGEVFEIFLFN